MKLSKTLLGVALSLAAVGAVAAVNMVNYGSFESGSSTALTGWTLKGNDKVDFSSTGSIPDGLRYIDLDSTKAKGKGFSNNAIEQTIVGTGLVYLSFWYAASDVNPGSTNEIKFSLGSFKDSVLNQASNSTVWQQYTSGPISLKSNGSTKLSFSAAGTADGIGGRLDMVSVSPVPEPATYAMLLAGLGLMGTVAVRRNKRKPD